MQNWFGPAIAVLQSSVPLAVRGMATGLFTATTAVGNLAPAVVGHAVGAGWTLRDALLVVGCGSYIISGALFAAMGGTLPTNSPSSKSSAGGSSGEVMESGK